MNAPFGIDGATKSPDREFSRPRHNEKNLSHPVHLILSPGTRIVTRNDANRIGGGQLIPAGAVAVITTSPDDGKHAYKVRCNDGAEAMLRRNEFSILKEFKNDEAVGRDSSRADSDFQHWRPFIIYRCVVGSQAFGLSGDDSDVDRRGIYLPPAELHWSLYGVPEQIENNDTRKPFEIANSEVRVSNEDA